MNQTQEEKMRGEEIAGVTPINKGFADKLKAQEKVDSINEGLSRRLSDSQRLWEALSTRGVQYPHRGIDGLLHPPAGKLNANIFYCYMAKYDPGHINEQLWDDMLDKAIAQLILDFRNGDSLAAMVLGEHYANQVVSYLENGWGEL